MHRVHKHGLHPSHVSGSHLKSANFQNKDILLGGLQNIGGQMSAVS